MSLFGRLDRISHRGTRIIGLIGLVGLLALSFATVGDVLMRWLFNHPLVGLNDTYTLFTAVIMAACFPICNSERDAGHITVRFLGRALGPRAFNILEAFGSLVTLIYFGAMAYFLWEYAVQLADTGQSTWVLGWPLAPWWRLVAILFILSLPPTLLAMVQFVRTSFKSGRPKGDTSPAGNASRGVH